MPNDALEFTLQWWGVVHYNKLVFAQLIDENSGQCGCLIASTNVFMLYYVSRGLSYLTLCFFSRTIDLRPLRLGRRKRRKNVRRTHDPTMDVRWTQNTQHRQPTWLECKTYDNRHIIRSSCMLCGRRTSIVRSPCVLLGFIARFEWPAIKRGSEA